MNKHHTKLKGDIAEHVVALDLVKKSYIVSRPMTECAPYDLICDTGARLLRIQVKYRDSGSVPTSSSWSDKNGSHKVMIDSSMFDYVALVNSAHMIAYVPSHLLGIKVCFFKEHMPKGFSGFWWHEDFADFSSKPQKRSHQPGSPEYAEASRRVSKNRGKTGPLECNEQLTRERLRELVWSMPSSHVAKLYNVSDSAIGKRCKVFKIDKPPRGYWQKLRKKRP